MLKSPLLTLIAPLPVTVPPVMLKLRISFDNEPMLSTAGDEQIAGGQAAGKRQASALNDGVSAISGVVHDGRAGGAFRQPARTDKGRVDHAAWMAVG